MPRAPTNTRARNVALLLAIAWTLTTVGGGWLLLRQAYARTVQAQVLARARDFAWVIASRVPAGAVLVDPKDVDKLDLSEPFDTVQRFDPRLLYALVWGPTGRVAGCTDPARVNTVLKPADYQPLEPGRGYRLQAREESPLVARHTDVLEVTVPLVVAKTPVGFVTLGYAQQLIDEGFWMTQRTLLYAAGAVAAAGMGLIYLVLRLTERAIERARQELEQNARARTSLLTERGMLASVLAHEVRSPLTALRFNLHSLRNYVLTEAGTEKQLELADRCEREIRRLDLMLNDFLSRTQIVAPAVPTPINRVVNEALAFLRPALDQRDVRVVTHLDGANPKVAVNPDELRQVLLNLAANAQDAIPAGKGGAISVSTVLDAEAANVTLLFRDSGVGIPPELHTRIFEPFFSTKAGGSGLGLALVRRVISGAGGTIFCESAPGEGTTFRIVLPQAVDEQPLDETPSDGPADQPAAEDAPADGNV
jgi:signal transduction histidine kinase